LPHAGDSPPAKALFLHIGLQTGLLIRTEVDPLTGRLSELRTRFLGTREPTLLPVTTSGYQSMLALSTRPWLGYLRQGKFQLVPLAYEALDYVAPFASESVPEGLVSIVRNAAGTGTLRVLVIERLAETFTQTKLPLAYTPRRMIIDKQRRQIILAESDKGAIPYPERTDLQVCTFADVCVLTERLAELFS
jgi:splicing factor 3B subunit 3